MRFEDSASAVILGRHATARISFQIPSRCFAARDRRRFSHNSQTDSLILPQCASASRWTSNAATITQDGTRRDKFAEFHASKTRQYIDRTMASGRDIFQVMQACVVLSWYLYQEGRWVEVWIYAGFQTRVAVPLRLNYPGTFSVHAANGPGEYLPPPQDPLEQEIRRRTWWMTILFDRTVSIGGWVHAVGSSLITLSQIQKIDSYFGR